MSTNVLFFEDEYVIVHRTYNKRVTPNRINFNFTYESAELGHEDLGG